MAAVFCFAFLPALASIALMFMVARGDVTVSTALAMTCFSVMASGVFVGLYRMAKQWEGEDAA